MPAHLKLENKDTTIKVSKHLKLKIRRFAKKSNRRSGYETDEEIISRILLEHERNNTPNDVPRKTYE